MTRRRVLLLGYVIDGTDVGEGYVGFKWAEALAKRVDLTVMTLERKGHTPLSQQLPEAKVVSWMEPALFYRAERLNAMLKPSWPLLMRHVRQWIGSRRTSGLTFDIAHQIGPNAIRYPSPFAGLNIPYVIGPVGGMLQTPEGFRDEVKSARWFTKFRALDRVRIAYDPWLRRTYAEAAAVIGVAPYVRTMLDDIAVRRFETMLEVGVDDVADATERARHTTGLHLLHVGRAVRTKGLRDCVRAMAQIKDLEDVTLTSAGEGEDLAQCRSEAEQLGVSSRIRFLGRIPRAEVEKLYSESDVFLFPSFREPGGSVLYEAMRWGLPVITANRGGPQQIVDESSGIRLDISTPEALAQDIASAIRRMYVQPDLRRKLGEAARDKALREGTWSRKAEWAVSLYESVLAGKSSGT